MSSPIRPLVGERRAEVAAASLRSHRRGALRSMPSVRAGVTAWPRRAGAVGVVVWAVLPPHPISDPDRQAQAIEPPGAARARSPPLHQPSGPAQRSGVDGEGRSRAPGEHQPGFPRTANRTDEVCGLPYRISRQGVCGLPFARAKRASYECCIIRHSIGTLSARCNHVCSMIRSHGDACCTLPSLIAWTLRGWRERPASRPLRRRKRLFATDCASCS